MLVQLMTSNPIIFLLIIKNLIRIIEMEGLYSHAPQQQHEQLHLVLLVCQ